MCFVFSLAYSSQKSQEILKNQNKATEKHPGRDTLLEKINVINQNLSKCRTSGTVLALKLDIHFFIIWDDLMEDGGVSIKNIFELLKQTVLIDADKNCADSDDCEGWDRLIFCNSTLLGRMLLGSKFCSCSVKAKFLSNYVGFPIWMIKKQASKKAKFHENKPFFFRW